LVWFVIAVSAILLTGAATRWVERRRDVPRSWEADFLRDDACLIALIASALYISNGSYLPFTGYTDWQWGVVTMAVICALTSGIYYLLATVRPVK
jgi:hypothetical protein